MTTGPRDAHETRYIGSRMASCWAHNARSYAKHASLVLRERARLSLLRAYIYNALFTTAKPPKIRLPPLLWLWASLFHTCPHTTVVLSLFFLPRLFLSRGVTVSFIRASQLTDTALCPFVSLLIPFISFIPSSSSHLRVLALTSRFSFVPVIDTWVNERDD